MKQITWKKIALIDAIEYEQPNPYIVNTKIKVAGKYPVLTPGKSFIKGYTDESDGLYTETPAIIFDDFTTASKYVDFNFKVKSSAMKILRPRDSNVNLKYVFYQMRLIRINTSTHKRYYISKYQNQHFIFPFKDGSIDVDTQNRLVGEIETQLTRLDATIKSLRTIKHKLEFYRRSILESAFKGNLTDCTFDANNTASLQELCIVNPGKKELKDADDDLVVTFLPMSAVSEDGKIFSRDTRKLKEVIKGYTYFCENDVLVAKITPCFENGKRAIARDLKNKIGFGSTEFHVLRPSSRVTSEWIFYAISRDYFRNIAKSQMTGTAVQKRVPTRVLEGYAIPVPEISVQESICQEIESRFSVIDKVGEVIDNALKKAERLRRSILKAAFEGKLIN